MTFGKGLDGQKDTAIGNNWDDEKLLRLHIYYQMKKEGFHVVADAFAKGKNLEMPELVDLDGNLLTEWWESFRPRFFPGLAKPSIEDALAMLASMKREATRFQQTQPPVLVPPVNADTEICSRVPIEFLLSWHRDAQAQAQARARNKSIQEVQEGRETAGIRGDIDNMRTEFPGEGVSGSNGPNSSCTSDVEEGNETGGVNNQV